MLTRIPRRTALALLAATSLLAGACTGGGQDQRSERTADAQANRNAMTTAVIGDAVSFHPYKTTDVPSREYQGLVYGGSLTTRDPENVENVIPEYAESWTISGDRLTYTFTLRPDLVWSDGTAMTSADYQYAFDQSSKPENAYPYITNYEDIESYTTPDPRTIVVRLKEPLAVGLELADAVTPLPKHIWERLDWNDAQRNPEILKPTVGSGPFLLQQWNRDDRAVFTANPRYFKGQPKLDTYVVRIAGTPQIALQWLRTGEIDMLERFPPENYQEVKRLDNITVYDWWPAATQWRYLGFNLRKPALQDVRVRQALAYAVNRDLIIERVLYNLARPTYSAYTPSCWCYNPDVPHRDYDLERAKALLDEAGWRLGPNGVRVKDGQPLSLRMLYGPNSSRTASLTAQVVQESWKQIGVSAEITGLEWAAYLSELKTPPFNWDVNVGAWSSTIDPYWMYQIWGEENIPELNHVDYRNPRVEALFKRGAREFDQEARKKIYQEIQTILTDDQPYVFLSYDQGYAGVNNRIGGIKPSPLGLGWNIEQWYVK